MLDKLHRSWKDPTLKWLDLTNGIGNYPIVVYYKLMEGLKTVKDLKIKIKEVVTLFKTCFLW